MSDDYTATMQGILTALYRSDRNQPEGLFSLSELGISLGLELNDLADYADILESEGYVRLTKTMSGNRDALARLTPAGKRAAMQGSYQSPSNSPILNIGIAAGNVYGGNLQGVGESFQSTVQQIGNDPEKVHVEFLRLKQALINEVTNELSEEKLTLYRQVLDEFGTLLQSGKPDESHLHRLRKTLSLAGDIEGSLALFNRVAPYVHGLTLLAQYALYG